jgi:hypothetical protein
LPQGGGTDGGAATAGQVQDLINRSNRASDPAEVFRLRTEAIETAIKVYRINVGSVRFGPLYVDYLVPGEKVPFFAHSRDAGGARLYGAQFSKLRMDIACSNISDHVAQV